MKNPDIKTENFGFEYTDLEVLEAHLTERAREGWRLVSVTDGFGCLHLTYNKETPATLRYSAQLFPGKNPRQLPAAESQEYISLCEESGWHFLGSSGILLVFFTDNPEIPDIVTDDLERINLIKQSNNRTYLYTWLMVLPCFNAFIVNLINREGAMSPGTKIFFTFSLCSYLLMVALFLYQIISTSIWHKKAKKNIEEGKPVQYFTKKDIRWRNIILWAMIGVCALGVTGLILSFFLL